MEDIFNQIADIIRLEATKSPECSNVLQLMDKDYSYTDAVNITVELYGCDRVKLEDELNKYI